MLPGNTPRIFLDTDVAFDIISKREPHFTSSIQFLHLTVAGKLKLVISESSLANLIYLSIDIYKIKDAIKKLSDFIGACELVHRPDTLCQPELVEGRAALHHLNFAIIHSRRLRF